MKWAGGKTQLLPELARRLPPRFERYFEPFAGGAALYFHLAPARACLSDSNEELMLTYSVVRDRVEELIERLHGHANTADYYYRTRAWEPSDAVDRAARLIYLNRTCFNGLYRVNRRGQFNVPFGRYAHPTICDPDLLRGASRALKDAEIRHCDYRDVVARAEPGDFVYFDPPYWPVSRYSDFKRYTRDFFYEADQRKLARVVAELTRRGCCAMVSNSTAPLVYELYGAGDYRCEVVSARRNINKNGGGRGAVDELIIRNY